MKNKRRIYVLGGAILIAFVGFAFASFSSALTPYVSYSQAIDANRTVQVAGALVAGSSSWDEGIEALWFTLEDPTTKEQLRVRYHGVKPGNFEDAVSIVAIGRWNRNDEALQAEKLLVKCPSKYQGLEGSETKGYESAPEIETTVYEAKTTT